VHVLHVTPHVPPDQAANALLPAQLGEWSQSSGDSVEYLAHPPRAGGRGALAGPATWIPRRSGSPVDAGLKTGAALLAFRVWRTLEQLLPRADLVHVHSNGLLAELSVLLARRAGRPVVLTLYGTEIWHYRPRRLDTFTRAYHAASEVTFYSERLLLRARELGLGRRGLNVIYPPVGPQFSFHAVDAQADARSTIGVVNRHMLLNVKRLHPLAGQRYLIEAMHEVVRVHPDTRLVICGTGPELEALKEAARAAGVARHVTFTGLLANSAIATYCAAADLFVLPSILEALPTVAVEALACGTPVLSTDNPGGLELNDLFGPDVAVVPREQSVPLAAAIVDFLGRKRRTLAGTREAIERTFRAPAVAAQYREIYERVVRGAVT
jgi:glycosyltransferase involved in cell wall biosynthesis